MTKLLSVSLIWRVTLLLTIFIRNSAFNFPTQKTCPSLKVACSQQVLSSRLVNDSKILLHSLRVENRATGSEQVKQKQSKKHAQAHENNDLPLVQSIAVVVASRRLSFLVLSILLVNFVRSTILKVRISIANCGRSFTNFYLTLNSANRSQRVRNSCSMNARGPSRPRTTPSNSSKIEILTWLQFGLHCVSCIRSLTRLVQLLNTIFTLSFAVGTSTLLLTIISRTIKSA